MKGKQMSAILAILLMLSGIVAFVPRAFAQHADAVQANPLTISYTYPAQGPGTTFTAYADVVNVDGLFAFQIGFYFNQAYLKVLSVAEGGFLSNNGADPVLSFPGSIDNVNGVVNTYGWTLQDPLLAKTGTGHLITVQFQILSTLFPPVIPPGTIYMHLTTTDGDPAQLKMIWSDGATVIVPTALNDGTISLSVVQTGPTAIYSITPNPPNYVGDLLTFDGSASLPGSTGYSPAPIVSYMWNFGDGNITTTPGATITHSYSAAGSYLTSLTVMDSQNLTNTAEKQLSIAVRPTGCVLDVYTQGWRYIDPFTYTGVLQGKGGNNLPGTLMAEMFRPGDLVQLFVMTAYNGDPVGFQFVAVEVFDAAGNVVLTGNALTDFYGFGEVDFRVPWPQDVNNPTPIFGTWHVIVTWEIGSNNVGIPPGSITQNDTMTFNVGWGVFSSDLTTTDINGIPTTDFHKGDTVYVSYKLHNEFSIAINFVNGVTLYDDLMVPIGFGFDNGTIAGLSVITVVVPITIPNWAFVGVGTVKANEYSTWPSASGIAFGPEQTAVFNILHTFNPVDP